MSATRIKHSSAWAHKNGKPEIRMVRIARDREGYVHTPSGWLPGARYTELRAAHPEHNFPPLEELPIVEELTEQLQALAPLVH